MLNLIIDGNYFLNRIVFALSKSKKLDNLSDVLLDNVKYQNKWYKQNKVYFVSDNGKSWRKDLYTDYKAKRKKDSSIDQDDVFKSYEEAKKEIKNIKGISVVEVNKLEGDDCINFIVNKTNLKNESNLIMTADMDIDQKITQTPNQINIRIRDSYKDEKLYMPKNQKLFKESLDNKPFDLNNLDNRIDDFFDSVVKKFNIELVDNEQSTFVKIVSGDSSDNIKSIYQKTGKTGKTTGIGDSGALKIYDRYKSIWFEDIDFESDSFINNLADVIISEKKLDISEKKGIINNIKNNILLILLKVEYLPIELLNELNTFKI